jgi:hypothetical protein
MKLPESTAVEAFIEASLYVGTVLASDEVRTAWVNPSVLGMMRVGDICGHVFLIVRRVGKRLESAREAADQAAVADPGEWTWSRAETKADLELPQHRQVRLDGAHVAAWGWKDVHDAYDSRVDYVSGLLRQGLPPATDVSGRRLPFSEYLVTRVVELVVHADDVACSVGVVSAPPDLACTVALDGLIEGSRSMHGDVALLRALSRVERAPDNISVF